MSKITRLSERHRQFIDELFKEIPFDPARAYRAVYPNIKDNKSAATRAWYIMRDPVVATMIEKRQLAARADSGLTAADILKELFLVATADPRDLVEYYRGACRHCYGTDNLYQRTQGEFARDLEAHTSNTKLNDPAGLKFKVLGGIGFSPKKPPLEECPECHGEGEGYSFIKDTRHLTPAAARLYAGVKQTKDGVQVLMRNPDRAIELAGQTMGLFKTNVEHTGRGGGPITTLNATVAIASITDNPQEAANIYRTLIGS